jgi:hypothetical protein
MGASPVQVAYPAVRHMAWLSQAQHDGLGESAFFADAAHWSSAPLGKFPKAARHTEAALAERAARARVGCGTLWSPLAGAPDLVLVYRILHAATTFQRASAANFTSCMHGKLPKRET